ncbi:hypothetical protein R83H12_02706 [Fibrobacteria bacterium R8-3-H12]
MDVPRSMGVPSSPSESESVDCTPAETSCVAPTAAGQSEGVMVTVAFMFATTGTDAVPCENAWVNAMAIARIAVDSFLILCSPVVEKGKFCVRNKNSPLLEGEVCQEV